MLRSRKLRSVTTVLVALVFAWLTTFDCATCCLVDVLSANAGGCQPAAATRLACCSVSSELTGDGLEAGAPVANDRLALSCPLLPTSYGESESASADDSGDRVAPAIETDDVFSAVAPARPPTPAPLRIENRGDTYLRCRVLLI